MTQDYRKGDVFLIPISESFVGIGQVVDVLPQELYLVVFKESWSLAEPPTASDVDKCTPLFSSLSLDAKLWNGDWKVVGNWTNNLSSIAIPLYKVIIGEETYVESYRGESRRVATCEEIGLLRNRKTVAPVRLENALKAFNGIGKWHSVFDELYHEYAKSSSKLR